MFKSRRLKTVSNALKSVASNDASAGISSKMFDICEVSRYGMNGSITTFAFDPIQSLLALATSTGEIHIYGKQQVEVVFTLDSKATIKSIRFVKGVYLVAADSKDVVLIFSLHTKKLLTAFYAPGKITCIDTDPSLDWMLIGLQSGAVIIYDIDRDNLSPIKIENLQKKRFFPQAVLSPVVSIQWNPRDIGSVLISYERVTVVYSLVDNQIKQHFIYELPPFAPGGDPSVKLDTKRNPKVVQSLYHPNSLHILTVHEDNSLVFWDANNGQLIQARTLFDTDVNVPKKFNDPSPVRNSQIFKVLWICQANPEYTSLLIAGGSSDPENGCHNLTMIDLGGTPMYSVTSYEKMSDYYANPVQQKIFPIPNDASVVNFLPLARKSPYYAGNHDPAIILVLLDDGEIETLLYPSGNLTYKASLFPQSISWVRPTATVSVATSVPKKLWLGMMSSTYNKDYLLKGGAPVKKPLRVHDTRSSLATGHKNGSVRIWDASHGELDDSSVFDVNVSHALNKATGISIDRISFASETAELAVSVEAGDVVFFKFQLNKNYNPKGDLMDNNMEVNFRRFSLNDSENILVDISNRAPTNLREGFLPVTAIHAKKGRTSALNNSNVGFVCIAYEDGTVMVVDRRGPAVIYMGNIRKISKEKSSYVSSVDFSIMEYGDDGYSSILMACGTDVGELIIFKVLPDPSGRFSVQPVDSLKTNDSGPVVSINSYSKDTGRSCAATISAMQDLAKGIPIPGFITIASGLDVRLVTPGKSKDTHKIFKHHIAACGLSFIPFVSNKGEKNVATIMICLLINGEVKVLSVPELKEIKSSFLPTKTNSKYIRESSVLNNGDIVVRVGKSEASLVTVVKETTAGASQGAPSSLHQDTDTLYNPNLRIECRPQVNSLQWARGTLYVKTEDLDNLLGGARRPKSKYEESALANGTISIDPQEQVHNTHELSANKGFQYQAPVRHATKTGGYGAIKYVSRAMENGMDTIEGTFNDYAAAANETMNEALEQTGSDLMKGAFRSKMGF